MDLILLEQKLMVMEKAVRDAKRSRELAEQMNQKCEREIKSLESVAVEDEKHTQALNKVVENLEATLESYKTKFEEAECMAAHNLNLYRRKQQELEEVEERTRLAEEKMKSSLRTESKND